MPQVEGGPKHLNHILESAYSSARSQGHDKSTASAIAWSAAKNKYKKHGGKWVVKFQKDLSDLAMILQDQIVKAPSAISTASNLEYLTFALVQLGELMKHDLTKIDEGNPLVWLGVDDVMLNPEHNPVDKKFQEECMKNIKETGEVKPLTYSLVDNDGVDVPMITDGFHRYHALKELGYKYIPARLSDERGTKTTDRDEPVKLEDTMKMEKKDKNPAVEYKPIDSFFLNPYHTPADRKIVDEKKDKIEENDEVKPLLYSEIDNNGKIELIIVDGFHRFIALKELGYTEIPVLKVGSQGIRISDTLKKVPLKKVKKEISSADVNGLGLVRQDLQGKPKKGAPKLDVAKGGQGSGCQGPNCGRPSGNKAFKEPFHSGSHVQQFLGSNDVVIGSVDKSNLSPDKNAARQKEFEGTLDKWGLPYKKGAGHSSQWGNETSYIVHAPRKEDAESLHHLLTRQYKQDAVIHVRNGHAVMNSNGGANEPIKHANINGGMEAGDHLDDNYTNVDGQKFRINFK